MGYFTVACGEKDIELFMNGRWQHRNLYITRGIPGTGKTTRVKKIVAEIECGKTPTDLELFQNNNPQKIVGPVSIFSADDYFGHGEEYKKNWSRDKVHLGHRDCEAKTLEAMKKNVPSIIVDNTSLTLAMFRVYLDYALDYGYAVYLVYPDSPWWIDTVKPFLLTKKLDEESKDRAEQIAAMLFDKNTHGVPLSTLTDMLMKFQWVTFDDYVSSTKQRIEAAEKEVVEMRSRMHLLLARRLSNAVEEVCVFEQPQIES